MIYVTGDTHGIHDVDKLNPVRWPRGQTLTRDDLLIVLGDFGAIWDWLTSDHGLLCWYDRQPWTTLFVDGNHENFDLIDAFDTTERFCAPVQPVPGYPHVLHLMRGYVYELPTGDGACARTLVMGGASSPDRAWRQEGISWWKREMPSLAEYERCVRSLEKVDFSVDYVLTHEVPAACKDLILGWHSPDELSRFLQWVDEHLDHERLRMWYAGHHHVDTMVKDLKHRVLYDDITPMDGTPRKGPVLR